MTDLPLAVVAPFVMGDMAGKREIAVQQGIAEAAKHEGVRKQLYELQSAVGDLPEVDCPLQHVFAPGAYARTIFIPMGTVIVGKIHKHQHLNILSQGEVLVITEGAGLQTLRGPLTMVSPAGTKRALRALTDVVWTTIHLTDKTNLAEIEDEVIAKDFEEYERFIKGTTMKKIEVSA